jgi:pimeloyl-ACP methyl ester carboxylesterase
MPIVAAGAHNQGMTQQAQTLSSASVSASGPDLPAWLDRQLYPFVPKRFATAEGEMRYVDEGRGTPIVLVHGTPSWSFEWRAVIAALRSSHRVIAPDHLGFGLSDKPRMGAYLPADHARRLLALFDALDLRDVTLVVHDFGGPIGLPIALERSERVRSAVVLNSWLWPLGGDPRVARISRFVGSALGRFLYTQLNASPRWLLPASFARRERLSAQVHRQYLAPFAKRSDRSAPWVLGRELTGSDPYYAQLWADRDKLARIPLTLVWGQKDPAFGSSELQRWQQAFPHATVQLLADAGHFPQEEQPETVIAAIRAAEVFVAPTGA